MGPRRCRTDAHPGRHRPRLVAAAIVEKDGNRYPSGAAGRAARACPPSRRPARPGLPGARSPEPVPAGRIRPGHRARQSWYARWTSRVPGRQPAATAPAWPGAARPAAPSRWCCAPSPPRPAPPSTPLPPAAVVVSPPDRRRAARPDGTCWPATSARPRRRAAPPPSTSSTARRALLVRCPGRLHRSAQGRQLLPAALRLAGHAPRRRARAHQPAADQDPAATTRPGSNAAAPTRRHRTCWSPRRPWRWASTSVTCPRCMLASLPRTVASYLQRVGRAGRLTGNALTSPTSPAAASSCPSWATRCR